MAKRSKAKQRTGSTALIKRLARLSVDALSDVLDVMGLPDQVLANTIQPLSPGMRIAGPAFCVRGRAIDPAHPAPAGAAFAVDRRLAKGDVVVTASGGWTASAVMGGNVVLSYKRRGSAGVITDGAVRDGSEMRRLGLPIFASDVTPRRPAGRWGVVELGQPIAMPGQSGRDVVVHPGDLIRGDNDGVVVIPAAIAAEVVAAAEKLERLEKRIAAQIKRGVDRETALKSVDRYAHIRRLVPA